MTVKDKEYENNYEHIISDQTFFKCQNILNKKNKAENISTNQPNENFPLKHFVVCAYCERPLTAYFSTGRWGGKYPYYRCYNRNCDSKKSIAKEKLEKAFLQYLEDITPKTTYLNIFKINIIDTWKRRYKELNQYRQNALKELEKLKTEKIELINMKRKELLSDEDFKEVFDKLKQEIFNKQIVLSDDEIEEFNIDETVSHVFDFIANIPKYWRKANFNQKIKIQGLIFPEKPIYDYKKFQTPQISPVLAIKKRSYDLKSLMVPPRGIEPLLPG
ncbi:MAG: recombinase zinc beta ribbon domain-containing protein [Candidatus Pacebacteria bacterium]|nr:recombinase zinc beta ribbon domain-containing protein [Candidatus Paceibacterota bacterium]